MSTNNSVNSIPKALLQTMQETMGQCVPVLCRQFEKNPKELNDLFKQKILHAPLDNALLQKNAESPEGKQICYLHKLYNDPDNSSRISAINADAALLKDFRERMLASFKLARDICQNVPRQEKNEQPKIDLNKFNPHPKDSLFDAALAKMLQEEYNRDYASTSLPQQVQKMSVSSPLSAVAPHSVAERARAPMALLKARVAPTAPRGTLVNALSR